MFPSASRLRPLSLLLALPAAFGAFAAAPGARPGDLVSLGKLESISPKDVFKVAEEVMKARGKKFELKGAAASAQQTFQQYVSRQVNSRSFTYASTDSHGTGPDGKLISHARTYSGRAFFPAYAPPAGWKASGQGDTPPPMAIPLVLYMHATETRRRSVPSLGSSGDETMLGAVAASMGGFAVVMPDGDGMGADTQERHHYCNGDTAARVIIDAIRAAIGGGMIERPESGQGEKGSNGDEDDVEQESLFDGLKYVWDGRVFIVGYSEGGYNAMAAVREISMHPDRYRDIPLKGAACMAGPFDFYKSTLALLSPDKTEAYDRPYIPAYFISSWNQILGDRVVPFPGALNQRLWKDRDASRRDSIVSWMNGDAGGDDITPWMNEVLTGDRKKSVPARDILDKAWANANLPDGKGRNEDSPLARALRRNSLVGGWTPICPVLLMHDRKDSTVTFDNTEAIYKSWLNYPAKYPPMEIQEMTAAVLDRKYGTGHVVGAVTAIPSAFVWIASGMPETSVRGYKIQLQNRIKHLAGAVLDDNAASALASTITGNNSPHVPLFGVSRVRIPRLKEGEEVIFRFDDWIAVVGKVKFYKLSDRPHPDNPSQKPITVDGKACYTQLIQKDLRKLNDSVRISTKDFGPGDRKDLIFMSVYPQDGFVALTLKATRATSGDGSKFIVNIKQLGKNKVLNQSTQAFFKNLTPGRKNWLAEKSFENASAVFLDLTVP